MKTYSWLSRLRGLLTNSHSGRPRRHASIRPLLERLEERSLLSGSPPTVLISGPPDVPEGSPYRLDLTAVDPEHDPVSQWAINWGDGSPIQTISGNPSSITHSYDTGPAIHNISASAVVGGETFSAAVSGAGAYQNPFVSAGSGGIDFPGFMVFGHDATGDGNADLYVGSEATNSILLYDGQTGAFIKPLITSANGLQKPGGIVFGPDSNLYVGSEATNSVLRYDGASGTVSVLIPTGSGGLNIPRTLIFGPDANSDGRQDLYINSWGSQQVLRYDGVTGAFLGVFSNTTAGLNDLAYGPDGNLYGSDGVGDKVLRFNGTTGAFMDTFVPAGSGQLDNPAGMAFGPDGDLYVASLANDKVNHYDGTTGAFLGSFSGGGLDNPVDVVFGTDNNFYVSGGYTDNVLRYAGPLTATANAQLPVTVLDVLTKTYSNTTAQTITDLNTITSVINIPDAGRVLDIDVTVDISHTYDADLDVWLISPSGTRIELFTDVGGSGDNFKTTTLDDEASAPITSGTAPYTGKFRPEGLLSTLDGQSASGNWTLEVIDDARGNKGKLNSWSLTLSRGVGPSALAAPSALQESAAPAVSVAQVSALLAEARARWEAAGADPSVVGAVDVRLLDLPGAALGMAAGHTIWLDANAAGWGWFVDKTPWSGSEFTTPGNQGEQNHMDLLSVLMHEMGHVLGLKHSSAAGDVMNATLNPGVRLLPTASDLPGSTLAGVPSSRSNSVSKAQTELRTWDEHSDTYGLTDTLFAELAQWADHERYR